MVRHPYVSWFGIHFVWPDFWFYYRDFVYTSNLTFLIYLNIMFAYYLEMLAMTLVLLSVSLYYLYLLFSHSCAWLCPAMHSCPSLWDYNSAFANFIGNASNISHFTHDFTTWKFHWRSLLKVIIMKWCRISVKSSFFTPAHCQMLLPLFV